MTRMTLTWICSTRLRPCSRIGRSSPATAAVTASLWPGELRRVSSNGRIASLLHTAIARFGASGGSTSSAEVRSTVSAVRCYVPTVPLNKALLLFPQSVNASATTGVSAASASTSAVDSRLRSRVSVSTGSSFMTGGGGLSSWRRTASTTAAAVGATSSTAGLSHEVDGRGVYNSRFPPAAAGKNQEEQASLGVDFSSVDVGAACTAGKSVLELLNGAAVYGLCACKPLVKNAERLLLLSEKIIGTKLTMYLLRSTVFRVFCGGEDIHAVVKTMKFLEQKGVKSALDYSVEACPGQEEGEEAEGEASVNQCNKYYEENLRLMIESTTGAAQQKEGFVAVKITAVGPVSVMEKASTLIRAADNLFARLTGVPIVEEMGRAPLHALLQQPLSRQKFLQALQEQQVDPAAAAHLINYIGSQLQYKGEAAAAAGEPAAVAGPRVAAPGDNKDAITYIQWMNACQPHKIGKGAMAPLCQLGLTPLSEKDMQAVEDTLERVDRLCEQTLQLHPNIPSLLVDAEHSPIQPFIRFVALEAMKKYNRDGRTLVYNTYQCYLRETESQLRADLEWARQLGVPFAVKLVRGAYIRFETELAAKLGRKCSPVFDCIEDTHNSYDTCARLLIEQLPGISVFFGTHNMSSLQRATALLSTSSAGSSTEHGGVPPNVYFGQLLGLGDHLTFALAKKGYSVYKYVPYGPVHITISYLLRRAQEVGCMPGGVSKELTFVGQEFKRRLLSLFSPSKDSSTSSLVNRENNNAASPSSCRT